MRKIDQDARINGSKPELDEKLGNFDEDFGQLGSGRRRFCAIAKWATKILAIEQLLQQKKQQEEGEGIPDAALSSSLDRKSVV